MDKNSSKSFSQLFYHYFEVKFNQDDNSKSEIIKLLVELKNNNPLYKPMIEVAIDYIKNDNITVMQLDYGYKLIYQLYKIIET